MFNSKFRKHMVCFVYIHPASLTVMNGRDRSTMYAKI